MDPSSLKNIPCFPMGASMANVGPYMPGEFAFSFVVPRPTQSVSQGLYYHSLIVPKGSNMGLAFDDIDLNIPSCT